MLGASLIIGNQLAPACMLEISDIYFHLFKNYLRQLKKIVLQSHIEFCFGPSIGRTFTFKLRLKLDFFRSQPAGILVDVKFITLDLCHKKSSLQKNRSNQTNFGNKNDAKNCPAKP